MSSPTQYIHSPLGETEAATKSPSFLPDEKLFTTWNKKIMSMAMHQKEKKQR
jgi:hypothetical protein